MNDCCFKYFIIPLLIISAVLSVIIFIIQFVIGIVFQGQCPTQPLIPTYNLVAGTVGLVIIFLSCALVINIRCKDWDFGCQGITILCLLTVLLTFELAWSIVGGVYTFPLRKNNITQFENPNLPAYCNPVLYWMSFVILIIYFSVLALMGVDATAAVPGSG